MPVIYVMPSDCVHTHTKKTGKIIFLSWSSALQK